MQDLKGKTNLRSIRWMRIEKAMYRAFVEPIRKAVLLSVLRVPYANDIEIWMSPRKEPDEWRACIKSAKGCYQLAVDVKLLPGRDEPWQDGRKEALGKVQLVRFYPFRVKEKLFPLKDDPELWQRKVLNRWGPHTEQCSGNDQNRCSSRGSNASGEDRNGAYRQKDGGSGNLRDFPSDKGSEG